MAFVTVSGPIDGNAFAIIGAVGKALVDNGYKDLKKEFCVS